jgi:NADPH2:quinone reductase
MKAILCTQPGPPEALQLTELPDPKPAAGEVVVDVAFAALNFFDTLIIQGKYQVKPPFPFSPSGECAGVVAEVGEGVTQFKKGDRVCGHRGYNCAREKAVFPEIRLAKVPDGLPLEKAAGLFVTYGTTIHALKDRGRIKAGDTLAILGASGGVGVAAVELGKVFGASVIACASSPEKLAFCKQHGADELIDYSKEDLKERLKELTGGKGVDIVYDPVGGKLGEAALRALTWEGRYLVIGFAGGEITKMPLNLTLLKGCDIAGVFWGEFVRRNPSQLRTQIEELMGWIKDGRVSAHVDKIYPFAEATKAFERLSGRQAMGKVLLKP